jgi:hypothetical protein
MGRRTWPKEAALVSKPNYYWVAHEGQSDKKWKGSKDIVYLALGRVQRLLSLLVGRASFRPIPLSASVWQTQGISGHCLETRRGLIVSARLRPEGDSDGMTCIALTLRVEMASGLLGTTASAGS